MKKAEIIKRLKELNKILNMTAAEYTDYWNIKHPDDSYTLKSEDAWAFRTGHVLSEIEWILNN